MLFDVDFQNLGFVDEEEDGENADTPIGTDDDEFSADADDMHEPDIPFGYEDLEE